jgi:hypothetical protein
MCFTWYCHSDVDDMRSADDSCNEPTHDTKRGRDRTRFSAGLEYVYPLVITLLVTTGFSRFVVGDLCGGNQITQILAWALGVLVWFPFYLSRSRR